MAISSPVSLWPMHVAFRFNDIPPFSPSFRGIERGCFHDNDAYVPPLFPVKERYKHGQTCRNLPKSKRQKPAPVKKSNKKLFIIIGAVLLLLGGGGAAAWFMTQGGHGSKEAHVEPAKPPVFLPLETFTVNLQGGEAICRPTLRCRWPRRPMPTPSNSRCRAYAAACSLLLSSQNAESWPRLQTKRNWCRTFWLRSAAV